MNGFFLRILSSILITTLLVSCAGTKVNPAKSNSYYYNSGEIYYIPLGNTLVGKTKLNVDKKSFEVLAEDIARDNKYVYYEAFRDTGIDRESFVVDKSGALKDKNYIYTREGYYHLTKHEIPGVDIETYVQLNDFKIAYSYKWAKDKNNYYYSQQPVNVDYDSFRRINDYFYKDCDSIYAIVDYRFYTASKRQDPVKLLNEYHLLNGNELIASIEDNDSLIINNSFEKIYNYKHITPLIVVVNDIAFFKGVPFKENNVDIESLKAPKIFRDELNSKSFTDDFYCVDKNHVYFKGEVLKEASPKGFTVLTFPYTKDYKHVFFKNSLLEGVDAKTFKYIGDKYLHADYRDGKGNYYNYDGKMKNN